MINQKSDMGSLDESKQTSEDLESAKTTTNNGNKKIVRPALAHDESIQFGSNKKLISFTSDSSSVSSDFSLENLEVDDHEVLDSEHDNSSLKLDTDEHDEKPNEESSDSGTSTSSLIPPPNDCISEIPPIQVMARPKTSKYRIPSHVFARKKSTTPGDWSMASNESLFSIHMGTSFCHHDSYIFSPEFNLPYDNQFEDGKILEMDEVNSQGSSMLDEPTYSEDKKNQLSEGETEKGSSTMEVPEEPKPEPSDDKSEPQKTTPLIAWTKWFPCFRYCACCS